MTRRWRDEGARRFWSKVERRGEDDCWIWTGFKGKRGHGVFMTGGRRTTAYRYAYEQLVGPVPAKMELDHNCRRPACVNPKHLEPVPRRVNILRGTSPPALNATKTRCRHGHLLEGDNLIVEKGGGRRCKRCRRNRGKREEDWV